MITDKSGAPIRDENGYVVYVLGTSQRLSLYDQSGTPGAMDVLSLDLSNPGIRNQYDAQCAKDIVQATNERDISGKVTGYVDLWGWLTAQTGTPFCTALASL